MAEVAVSRQMFNEIQSLIARLRAPTMNGGCGQMRRPTVQGAARRTHSEKFRHHEAATDRFGRFAPKKNPGEGDRAGVQEQANRGWEERIRSPVTGTAALLRSPH
jgi:hypothetical protein